MKKYRFIVLVVIIAIALGIYLNSKRNSDTPIVKVYTVSTGSLTQSIKTTGNISPIQTSTLSFERNGTVKKIFKNEWEFVTEWEVIAETDAEIEHLNISNASLALKNSQNSYNKLFADITESEKARKRNTLKESEDLLINLTSQYEDLLRSQENSRIESDANIKLLWEKLSLAKSEFEYESKNITSDTTSNNIERDLTQGMSILEEVSRFIPDTIENISDIMYIDNKGGDRYGDLGAKDQAQKIETEKLYYRILEDVEEFNNILISLRKSDPRTYTDTVWALSKGKNILDDMNSLTAMVIIVYNNSYISAVISNDFADSQRGSLRTIWGKISTQISSTNTILTTLKNYGNEELDALADKNRLSQKSQAVLSIENDLSKAKANLLALKKSQETERSTKTMAIERQKEIVNMNKLSYEETIQGPRQVDIISAKNAISQAQINLEKAKIGLKDYQIIASFEGKISDIPWNIGDTSKWTEWILIENKNTYEISISLDQIDIIKVNTWMTATIILDAFPTHTFSGKVLKVSSSPIETAWVISYEATVGFEPKDLEVYSQMKATVEVLSTTKEDIIKIPTSFILTNSGKPYVKVVKNSSSWESRDTAIVIGISDGEFTEVISWLWIWDQITPIIEEEEKWSLLPSPPEWAKAPF
jgi:multidrug efflux pump subunit AcrA (membrane-fusion protein)